MLQNRRNLFLEGFLNNVWICAAGGRNPVLAGAGDRKQGERGDFHRGSFSRNLGSGGDVTAQKIATGFIRLSPFFT